MILLTESSFFEFQVISIIRSNNHIDYGGGNVPVILPFSNGETPVALLGGFTLISVIGA